MRKMKGLVRSKGPLVNSALDVQMMPSGLPARCRVQDLKIKGRERERESPDAAQI